MKANEFVKKFGWSDAKKTSNPKYETINKELHYCVRIEDYTDGLDDYEPCPDCVNIADLKRIVESHDYIKSLGGTYFVKDNLPLGYFGDGNYKELIQECLEDVESCL